MFPLVAVGAAALAGAWIATEVASDSKSSSSSRASRKDASASADAAQQVVSPQSYIVTPVQGPPSSAAQRASIVDLVGKIIV